MSLRNICQFNLMVRSNLGVGVSKWHIQTYLLLENFLFNSSKGRIATRSKKPKNSQKSTAPHFGKNITTFAKADLPSDDEEDVEFNISSDKHEEEEEEEEDEDEEEDFSEADDVPVLQDEDTQTSIRSVFKPKI